MTEGRTGGSAAIADIANQLAAAKASLAARPPQAESRSVLRMKAAQSGICPICTNANVIDARVKVLEDALEELLDADNDAELLSDVWRSRLTDLYNDGDRVPKSED